MSIMHERNRERNSPVSRLDVGWVRQSTPRKLRECLPELEDTLGLHLEPTLLRHGRVPAVSIVISFNKCILADELHTCSMQSGAY